MPLSCESELLAHRRIVTKSSFDQSVYLMGCLVLGELALLLVVYGGLRLFGVGSVKSERRVVAEEVVVTSDPVLVEVPVDPACERGRVLLPCGDRIFGPNYRVADQFGAELPELIALERFEEYPGESEDEDASTSEDGAGRDMDEFDEEAPGRFFARWVFADGTSVPLFRNAGAGGVRGEGDGARCVTVLETRHWYLDRWGGFRGLPDRPGPERLSLMVSRGASTAPEADDVALSDSVAVGPVEYECVPRPRRRW